MKQLITITALLGGLFFSSLGMAEKIGFVNVTILFNEYARTKGIDKMIEDRFTAPKKEIEKLVTDIKALEKEIKTNELLMSESKLTASKNKLGQMVQEYREKGMALEKQLQEVRNQEMTEFRKIVFEVTQEFAKQEKYDLIVNEGVMFAAEKVDITRKILDRVNSKITQ